MALIKCYDCGAAIHEHANPCPKCGSYFTKGVQCLICGGQMRHEDSALWASGHMHSWIHAQCGARLFDHRGQCRECGRTITRRRGLWTYDLSDWLSNATRKCGECGVPDPLNYLGMCATCHLPVLRRIHEVSTLGIEHRQCEERRTTPVEAEAKRLEAAIARGWKDVGKAVAILAGVIFLYEFFAYFADPRNANPSPDSISNIFLGMLRAVFGAVSVVGVLVFGLGTWVGIAVVLGMALKQFVKTIAGKG